MFLIKKPSGAMNKRHEVLFYSNANCPLCDEAREVLHTLKRRFFLNIQEIDITADSAIFEKYKNIIPVVIIDGKFTFGARVSEDDILSCLKELKD